LLALGAGERYEGELNANVAHVITSGKARIYSLLILNYMTRQTQVAQHQLAYKYKVALCIQGSVSSANGMGLVVEYIVKYIVYCKCIH